MHVNVPACAGRLRGGNVTNRGTGLCVRTDRPVGTVDSLRRKVTFSEPPRSPLVSGISPVLSHWIFTTTRKGRSL
jgi:hypothetical protein